MLATIINDDINKKMEIRVKDETRNTEGTQLPSD